MSGVEKTLAELARLLGGELDGDPERVITDVASIEEAGPGEITFVADDKSAKLIGATRAGAVIVRRETGLARAEAGVDVIRVENAHLAFSVALELFRPALLPGPGVHAGAWVHPEADVAADASVCAFAVVESGARLGAHAVLYPGVYVGPGAVVGAHSILHPGVVVMEGSVLGERVVVHANSVIGSDGFGYVWDEARGVRHKIPQKGIVRIHDDVEIGAGVTIDRATVGETVIGAGTKIDNLVQVAHNVVIGANAVLVAQVGIAGSATIGERVVLGGQAGVAGHTKVGDDSVIGAKSGVTKSLPSGVIYSGMPAMPHGEWRKSRVVAARLPEMKKKISELELRVRALEGARRETGSG